MFTCIERQVTKGKEPLCLLALSFHEVVACMHLIYFDIFTTVGVFELQKHLYSAAKSDCKTLMSAQSKLSVVVVRLEARGRRRSE